MRPSSRIKKKGRIASPITQARHKHPRISSLLYTRFECENVRLTTRSTSEWNNYLEPVGPILASLHRRQNMSVKYLHRLEQFSGAYRDSVHRTSARLRKHVRVYSLISLERFESPIRCPLTVRALISKWKIVCLFFLVCASWFLELTVKLLYVTVIYGFAQFEPTGRLLLAVFLW